MHVSTDRWKGNLPGGIDKLNTFFIPKKFDNDIPVIQTYKGDIPDEFLPFRYVPRGNRGTHYFLDDYRFECVWNRPYVYAERFRDKLMLSPDFSMYSNWPLMVQKWNTYRNRWLGAYFQEHNIRIIPSVSWSDRKSFSFCFSGIPFGSMVAISTRGVSRYKNEFSLGFDAMVRQIDPDAILCCGDISKVYTGNEKLTNVVTYILEQTTFRYKRR